jgi:hypothetical protein
MNKLLYVLKMKNELYFPKKHGVNFRLFFYENGDFLEFFYEF